MYTEPNCSASPISRAPRAAAGDRAHAADDDHHQRREQEADVLPRRERLEGPAHYPGKARQPRPEGEDGDEDELDADPARGQHVAVVHAGADRHPDPGAVEQPPHHHPDDHRGGEDHETHHRVLQVDRLSGAATDGGDQRGLDRADQPVGGKDLVEVAAPDPEHDVGHHDRNPDRHQGLAKILPLHPAEYRDLQDDPEDGDRGERHHEAEHPRAGPFGDLVPDVAPEEIERSVREVDVAHQAEDQREPAGHEEVEAAEGDAVEQGVQEDLLAPERRDEPRRPRREDQPQQHRDRDQDRK